MQLTILLAAGAVALASVAAFAQMQHPNPNMPMQPPHQRMGPPMHQPGGMHQQGGMHGNMHGNMHAGMHKGMHGGMPGHGAVQPKGDTGPSSLAFQGINMKMHEAMNITFTGNADVDFVKGMIPHHQGAVDMAKTVLAFGKDPDVRKLAEEIIKAQETEIALMNEWLKRRGQ
jgi:uncharacterized protein (DUF305 family)